MKTKKRDCHGFFKLCENLSSVGLLSHPDLTKDKTEASLSSVIHLFCLPGRWNHRTHAEVGQRLTFDLPVRTVYDSVLRITSITGLIIKPEDCVPGAAACEEKLQRSVLVASSKLERR